MTAKPRRKKRDRYEPGDRKVPAWVVPKSQVNALPPCAQCGEPFKLDGAGGVSGGLAILDEGAGKKRYYHGYPEEPARDCYHLAESAGFP